MICWRKYKILSVSKTYMYTCTCTLGLRSENVEEGRGGGGWVTYKVIVVMHMAKTLQDSSKEWARRSERLPLPLNETLYMSSSLCTLHVHVCTCTNMYLTTGRAVECTRGILSKRCNIIFPVTSSSCSCPSSSSDMLLFESNIFSNMDFNNGVMKADESHWVQTHSSACRNVDEPDRTCLTVL